MSCDVPRPTGQVLATIGNANDVTCYLIGPAMTLHCELFLKIVLWDQAFSQDCESGHPISEAVMPLFLD